jgi:hypothetical protein
MNAGIVIGHRAMSVDGFIAASEHVMDWNLRDE